MIATRIVELERTPPAAKFGKFCFATVLLILVVAHGPAAFASPLMAEAGETLMEIPGHFNVPTLGDFDVVATGPSADEKLSKNYNQISPSSSSATTRREVSYSK